MKNVLQYFVESLEKFPDRQAIYCQNQYYSYSEFFRLVANIQTSLIEIGSSKEPVIGIVTGDDVHTYASILGILFSGSSYVPINRKNSIENQLEVIESLNLKTILHSSNNNELQDISALKQIRFINSSEVKPSKSSLALPKIDSDSLLYILFTSGSTGKPKGVKVTHGNFARCILPYHDKTRYDLSEKDRFLQSFELTFDLSGLLTFVPWSLGACSYIVPEQGMLYSQIVSMTEEHNIDVLVIVPSILLYVKPYFDEIMLNSLKYSMFIGEPLQHELMTQWSNCVGEKTIIQNLYGPTECPGASSIYTWKLEKSSKESRHGIVPLGKPNLGMEFFILNEKNEIMPDGETGEIALSSQQVSVGYWQDEERTSQSFISLKENGKRVYKTGDLAYKNENGDYIFCGRRDFQLNLNGYRVEPGEIEFHTRNFIKIENVAAIAKADKTGLSSIYLLLHNFNGDVSSLEEYLITKLPEFMVPREIVVLSDWPLNQNGKTDRKQLKKMFESNLGRKQLNLKKCHPTEILEKKS